MVSSHNISRQGICFVAQNIEKQLPFHQLKYMPHNARVSRDVFPFGCNRVQDSVVPYGNANGAFTFSNTPYSVKSLYPSIDILGYSTDRLWYF
jgi:hypothetical protein